MLQDLDRTLIAALARTLELDAELSGEDAAARVAHLAGGTGIPGLEEHLRGLAAGFTKRGVINPKYLQQDEIQPYFFLANGRPGLLGQVIHDSERAREGVSQYVLYGHWDSLLVLYGSADEAARQLERLQRGAYEDTIQFRAQDVLLSYRRIVPAAFTNLKDVTAEDINNAAIDYDGEADSELRESLLAGNILIGSALTHAGSSPYPITAFAGISVRARVSTSGSEVLDALLAQDDLRRCLIDVFRIEQGVPFHYFAKVSCASVDELDAATNAIAFASRGGMRFEGETLVVAHGSEQLPLARKPDVASVMVVPDLGAVARTAQRVFESLGPHERLSFNSLPEERQLATLRALAGLQVSVSSETFDGITQERIESAIATFAREATKIDASPNLTGAVVEVTSMVEVAAKKLLSRLAYSVCGNDPALIQRELKLPTRKIRSLTLGKVVQAFRAAASEDRFASVWQHIPEEWLDRLSDFADERNSWAHGVTQGTDTQMIDQAFAAIREGVAIAGWLAAEHRLIYHGQAEAAAGGEDAVEGRSLQLPQRPHGAEFRVFVSHTSADNAVAERLAMGLQAVGYGSWFAEWELRAGDSIIARIEAALSTCDVLIVVLSRKSVTSGWVQRELNSALMGQLSGQSVQVIPVLIEDCEIPVLLKDTLYVDLRQNFEAGFLKLLDSLRVHRNRINR